MVECDAITLPHPRPLPDPLLVSDDAVVTSRPYARLYGDVSRLLADDEDGALSVPLGNALISRVRSFLEGGWHDLSPMTEHALEALPDRDEAIARAYVDDTRDSLDAIVPEATDDRERLMAFTDRVQEAAYLNGERLVAMQIAGESEQHIDTVAAATSEVVQNAHLAGRVYAEAWQRDCLPSNLAPSVAAAVLAYAIPGVDKDARDYLSERGLMDGSQLRPSALRDAADRFQASTDRGERRIYHVARVYARMAREAFSPEPSRSHEELRAELERVHGRVTLPGDEDTSEPAIDLRTLTAFAASARGGTDKGRIDGALELFRTIISVSRNRRQEAGRRPSRYAVLNEVFKDLQGLSGIVADERHVHRDVKRRWEDIDRELEYQKRRGEAPVYPLPDRMTALEARGLYLQDVVYKGMPLGVALAEIHDSPQLTFGPTEREFLERLVFYTARRYAADLAVDQAPEVGAIADENLIRAEEVRQALGRIEIDLREAPYRSDEALREEAERSLERAVEHGELRSDDARRVQPVIDDMITRIRAGQEVLFLTGMLAAEHGVPEDIVEDYADLPHTRRFAMVDDPETVLFNMQARNGQSMRELEQDTRARWMRYRHQAPAGVDVMPVQVGAEDADEQQNPMRYAKRRSPFKRDFRDIKPGGSRSSSSARPSASSGGKRKRKGKRSARG